MMEPRLAQIQQFGIGSVLVVIGLIGAVAGTFLYLFMSPPAIHNLESISGALVEPIKIHKISKGGLWASVNIQSESTLLETHIQNYGLIWSCNDKPNLLSLEKGDLITIWAKRGDLKKDKWFVIWRLDSQGESLLTFDQTITAFHQQQKNYFYLVIGTTVLGALLMFWGWIKYRRQFGVANAL